MPWFGGGGSGGGGSDVFLLDKFTATPAQTVFTLTSTPASPANVLGWVDGVFYESGVDFSIVGNVATWLDVDFALEGGESVDFYYQI